MSRCICGWWSRGICIAPAPGLVVTKDGETPVPYGMFWAGMCGTEAEYWELHFAATTPGLYFYHFELDTPWGLHFVAQRRGRKRRFSAGRCGFSANGV